MFHNNVKFCICCTYNEQSIKKISELCFGEEHNNKIMIIMMLIAFVMF